MKEKIINVAKQILLTNNPELILKTRNDLIELINKNTNEKTLFLKHLVPVIEEDFDKIIREIENNSDNIAEKEKLRVVLILSALITLL